MIYYYLNPVPILPHLLNLLQESNPTHFIRPTSVNRFGPHCFHTYVIFYGLSFSQRVQRESAFDALWCYRLSAGIWLSSAEACGPPEAGKRLPWPPNPSLSVIKRHAIRREATAAWGGLQNLFPPTPSEPQLATASSRRMSHDSRRGWGGGGGLA